MDKSLQIVKELKRYDFIAVVKGSFQVIVKSSQAIHRSLSEFIFYEGVW
jgi:hypothetical protein